MKAGNRLALGGIILVIIGLILLSGYLQIRNFNKIESVFLEDLEKANKFLNSFNSADMENPKSRFCFALKKYRIMHMAVFKLGYIEGNILYQFDQSLYCLNIPSSIIKNCEECFVKKSENVLMKQLDRLFNKSVKAQTEPKNKKFEPEELDVNFWIRNIYDEKQTKKSYLVKLIEKIRNKKFNYRNSKKLIKFIHEARQPLQQNMSKIFYLFDNNRCWILNRSSYCVFLKDKIIFYKLKDVKSNGEFNEPNYEIQVLNYKFNERVTIDLVACLYNVLYVQNS